MIIMSDRERAILLIPLGVTLQTFDSSICEKSRIAIVTSYNTTTIKCKWYRIIGWMSFLTSLGELFSKIIFSQANFLKYKVSRNEHASSVAISKDNYY